VVGYGQTLQKALTSLLDQPKLSPQQSAQEQDDKLILDSDAQTAIMTEKDSTAYVHQYDLRSKTTEQSNMTAFGPIQTPWLPLALIP
jgi:hypothetical protein